MPRINSSRMFTCLKFGENFRFDPVGEYELVPCPIYGTEFGTIRKGQALLLEPLGFNRKSTDIQNKTGRPIELRLR